MIVATDESGNIATSTEESFTTLSEPEPEDVDVPMISSISSSVASTSVEVNFETNEDATSSIWYSTSTPLVVDEFTLSKDNATLSTSHDFILDSLVASTTYYFILTATDEALNQATSSEESFITI